MTEFSELIINGIKITPGTFASVMLPMPKLYDSTPISMPVHIIRGKTPGPTLCVTGAIHGDEVNGTEIVRRLLRKPALKKISGTLIAIPIVNVYGFLLQSRYLMDRRDLNRSFPGSEQGSLAARLAHVITTEILSQSTHFIDLHTGTLHRENLPQVRTDLSMPGIAGLAESFNVPVILNAPLRSGSLRQYAHEKSLPCLLYEAGESLRFNETAIDMGVNGILGVMQKLEMISIKEPAHKKFTPAFSYASYWIRAPHSGILRPLKSLGKKVSKGEVLAKIGNPINIEDYPLISPISGIIVGKSNLPLVHEGAALFHIASFEETTIITEELEYLQEAFIDTSENFEGI
ncbi:MAG: succinylglutamate desuccinylase / aspartoacylase family [Gammaproteobacteria bacterium]|jgi:predicted deacylase|nr:succinylglutamate desuccinylase / aspartoacylase family [Gammaproteobacteria bacterium]